MKIPVIRFKCDAPECEDVVDVEGQPQTPVTAVADTSPTLPDGWIEFSITGSTPGGQPALVHASTPACAAKLAEDQVSIAVEVSEAERAEEERRREQAEEDAKEAEERARQQAREEAQRQAEALVEEEERQKVANEEAAAVAEVEEDAEGAKDSDQN